MSFSSSSSDDDQYPGLKWSKEAANKANQEDSFIGVRKYKRTRDGAIKKADAPLLRKKSGLIQYLKSATSNPKGDVIYIEAPFWISGTVEDVRRALLDAKTDARKVESAIGSAIHIGNLADHEARYENLKADNKKIALESLTNFTISDIHYLARLTRNATAVQDESYKGRSFNIRGRRSPTKRSPLRLGGGRIKGNLRARAKQCGESKASIQTKKGVITLTQALNIDKLKEDRSGAKACYPPRDFNHGARSRPKRLVHVPSLNVVLNKKNIAALDLYLNLIDATEEERSSAYSEFERGSRLIENAKSPRGKKKPAGPLKTRESPRGVKLLESPKTSSEYKPKQRLPQSEEYIVEEEPSMQPVRVKPSMNRPAQPFQQVSSVPQAQRPPPQRPAQPFQQVSSVPQAQRPSLQAQRPAQPFQQVSSAQQTSPARQPQRVQSSSAAGARSSQSFKRPPQEAVPRTPSVALGSRAKTPANDEGASGFVAQPEQIPASPMTGGAGSASRPPSVVPRTSSVSASRPPSVASRTPSVALGSRAKTPANDEGASGFVLQSEQIPASPMAGGGEVESGGTGGFYVTEPQQFGENN